MDELDPVDRRRIQNRNAQRKYRHRRNQHRVAQALAADGPLQTREADVQQDALSGPGPSGGVDPHERTTSSVFAQTVEQHRSAATTYNTIGHAFNPAVSSVSEPEASIALSHNDTQGVAAPLSVPDLLGGISGQLTDSDGTPTSDQLYTYAREHAVPAPINCSQQPGYVDSRDCVSMLHIASIRGHTHMVSTLLEYPLSIDEPDTSGRTPLHLATMNRSTDVVCLLLSRGARVDLEDASGRTALHWAVIQKHEELLHILLQKGADVNQCDQNGWSPLHVCVERGWEEGFRVLMGRGADLSLRAKKCEAMRRGEAADY